MSSSSAVALACRFQVGQWQETGLNAADGVGELKRASVVNVLSGPLEGEGQLEYQLLYPVKPGGDAVFIGYERVTASWGDRRGSFVLKHDGVYSPSAGVSGRLTVVADSGGGDFAGLSGDGRIVARAGEQGGEYLLTLRLG